MSPQEFDSQDADVYKRLKTAKDYGYDTKPCDICKKTDVPVRFWGGTSVLMCGRTPCLEVMQKKWDECMNEPGGKGVYQWETEQEDNYWD